MVKEVREKTVITKTKTHEGRIEIGTRARTKGKEEKVIASLMKSSRRERKMVEDAAGRSC